MDDLTNKLEFFTDEEKEKILINLNKCLNKFFQSKLIKKKKFLEKCGVNPDHIKDLQLCDMASFGIITMDEYKKQHSMQTQ
jgi:hypothetical protein